MAKTTDQMIMDFAEKGSNAMRAFEATREEARHCRACHLWQLGTQTVFGEGPVPAPIMLIGEQPGDKEDLSGKPFVGPAGMKLNAALEEASIDRKKVYVTNAVKPSNMCRAAPKAGYGRDQSLPPLARRRA
jgi:uracil-DNA glycosylase